MWVHKKEMFSVPHPNAKIHFVYIFLTHFPLVPLMEFSSNVFKRGRAVSFQYQPNCLATRCAIRVHIHILFRAQIALQQFLSPELAIIFF